MATVCVAGDGQYYFVLKAANGELLATGETYSSKSNAQHAVDTIVGLGKAGVK